MQISISLCSTCMRSSNFTCHAHQDIRCYLWHAQKSPSHHISSRDQREVTSKGLRRKYHSGWKIPEWMFLNWCVFNILSEHFLPLSISFFLWMRKRRASLVNITRGSRNKHRRGGIEVVCGNMQVVVRDECTTKSEPSSAPLSKRLLQSVFNNQERKLWMWNWLEYICIANQHKKHIM